MRVISSKPRQIRVPLLTQIRHIGNRIAISLFQEVPMAYYKVRIEIWCDWDPKKSDLQELSERSLVAKTQSALCRRW